MGCPYLENCTKIVASRSEGREQVKTGLKAYKEAGNCETMIWMAFKQIALGLAQQGPTGLWPSKTCDDCQAYAK